MAGKAHPPRAGPFATLGDVLEDRGARVWPMAVALTTTLVVGGIVGYLIGRPSKSPAPSRALSPGMVRVPDVSGLTLGSARRVLRSLGAQAVPAGRTRSLDVPDDVVVDQSPAPGAAVRAGSDVGVTVSSGPGPAAGPTYVYARSVLVPIRRTGPFSWTSREVALDGDPVSLGANTRAIGADTTPYRISRAPSSRGTAMRVRFEVRRFDPPAWFVILKAFGRQRETGSGGPSLTVTPASGPAGTVVTVEGHACAGSRAPDATVAWRAPGDARDERLPITVSAYAFRTRLRLEGKDLRPGAAVTIRAGDRCRATFDLTA